MRNLARKLSLITLALSALVTGFLLDYIMQTYYDMSPVVSAIAMIIIAVFIFACGRIPGMMPAGSLFMAISAVKITPNPDGKNIGGAGNTHFYAFEEDIDTWPTALTPSFLDATTFGELVTVPVDDVFVMVTDKYFHAFPCTEEMGSVKSTLVGPVDCKGFENEASFGNPGNNDPLMGCIAYIANKRVVIVMQDLNGTLKVVGTPYYAARIDTAVRDSGMKVADGNSLKHTFKACAFIPCPTLLSPLPLDSDEA